MPPEAASPGRLTLAAIVSQAWLLGGGLGTGAGIAILSLLPGSGAAGLGWFALIAVLFGVLLSSPLALAGIALVAVAPRWAVRWRIPLCFGLPALVAAAAAAFTLGMGGASPRAPALPGLAVFDAGLAALWVHRRTRRLARAQDPAALAAVFR